MASFLSSILAQPTPTNLGFEEGVVVSVNISTYTAQVRTLSGRKLTTATWITPLNTEGREADIYSPVVGSNVLVYLRLGRPLILGCVPTAALYSTAGTHSITQTQTTPNYYPGVSGVPSPLTHKPGVPTDYLRGDRVFTTKGGALFGLLFGTIVVKVSWMAQIVLSKFDDVIKIISRNYEKITDASTEVDVNFRGRTYNFFGSSLTRAAQVNSQYGYYKVIGDTVAGSTLQEGSYGQAATAVGAATNIIYKEVTQTYASGSPVVMSTVTYDGTTGTYYRQISGPTVGGVTLTLTHTNNSWSVVLSSPAAQITLSPSSVYAAFGSGTLTMNSSEIQAAFGSSTLTLNSSTAQLASNGHSITVTSAGVATA